MPKQKRYPIGTPFSGTIGRTLADSEQAWPQRPQAKKEWPNILWVLLDDTGFGQLGCYGSPIATPNIDKLAAKGLRYINWHTTALCAPTRAALLTGRSHHSNAMACIAEIASGFPGYNSYIPKENGFISDMLVEQGYATFALGKWHVTPGSEMHAAAPRDRWPLGQGFERYYGYLGGATDNYEPELVIDNHRTERPDVEDYHLTEDLTDQAIKMVSELKATAPDKPFFIYYAPVAMHTPHQAPQTWINKYKGAFDEGWDVYREKTLARQKEMGLVPENTELPPREPEVQPWEDLSADQKKLYTRMMEVFAGFLEHTDYHIGRLIDFLEEMGELDNTLIMLMSDNGASSEGGPNGSVNEFLFFNGIEESLELNMQYYDKLGGPECYNNYPMGWTMAGNTPFRRWKKETFNGGICDPLIVTWPKGISAQGELRDQYSHVIDMVPTLLDVLGVEPPKTIKGVKQSLIEGVSLAHTFDDAEAPAKKKTQYYEMFGQRALWHNGWKAICNYPFGQPVTEQGLAQQKWELYCVDPGGPEPVDRAELHDVADKYPDIVEALKARWWSEAEEHNVFPLQGGDVARMVNAMEELGVPDRDEYVYYPDTPEIPENGAVNLKNRSHSITAEVVIPEEGAEGVLLAHGGLTGGYSFYMQDGKLHYVHNFLGLAKYYVHSDTLVPRGNHTLRFEFEKTGEHQGRGVLTIDDHKVGEADIERTVPVNFGINEGLTCGYDNGLPVIDEYPTPYRFTGKIKRVTVIPYGEEHVDHEKRLEVGMSKE